MSIHSIRHSFLRAARRQIHTAELGHPILRLILGLALALDWYIGHPLWPTLAIIAAVTAVFVRGTRELRRVMADPSPGAEGPAARE